MQTDKLTIKRWFDRHLHIRDGELMGFVLPETLRQRATGAVIMGNLKAPDHISTVEKALAYRRRIQDLVDAVMPGSDFRLAMTLYLTDDISPEEVVRGYQLGAWAAVKLYMADQKGEGGTTGSQQGVRDLRGRYGVFEAMQSYRIPLLGHFEAVERDVDEFDREIHSVDRDLAPLVREFRDLPIVVEHVTDARTAEFVARESGPVYATVTAHHLFLNRNDMFWNGMSPGHYCKPVPKLERDRKIVLGYVTSGKRMFGAGTDSAPHDEAAKSKCHGCAAGIFTAPSAVELYATAFEREGRLENLEAFLSRNFLDIYGVQPSDEDMVLERAEWTVPEKVGPVRVFKGGEVLPWKLVS